MNTMYRKPTQLSVVAAVAALAIFAVAAVVLLSGSSPAQATTASPSPVVNEDGGAARPVATPRTHATPEPCPGETGNTNTKADHVVDSGHIALFDVYWNPDELELTNSSCPPTVEHVAAREVDGEPTPAQNNRSASNINIDETIIHIPNSAKVTLNETDYPKDKYGDVWKADALENRDTDSAGDAVGDGMVWKLPACPPDNAASDDDPGLCISFSAALLNTADWDGAIEYHVDHVHQIDIDKQDPRYVLAYDGGTARPQLQWNSANLRTATMPVAAGGYDRPEWFFTDRGTYEFQVHIRGNPQRDSDQLGGLDPISKDASVTSDVREYFLHVGAEADLGVSISDLPQSPSPNDNVTITITASNIDGPDEAQETKVDVSLPSGLVSPTVDTVTKGTYSNGVWTIGSMCNPAERAKPDSEPPEPECPQEATLTITATVRAKTHGETLTAEATISATETVEITETVDGATTVETYHVSVLDPNTDNDTATVSTTVTSIRNVDPHWDIVLMVEENTQGGTPVGDELWVFDDDGDTLTFKELTDQELESMPLAPFGVNGADLFTHSVTRDGDFTGVQIAVESGASLDHETAPAYFLAMGVQDSKDAQGNADETIDDVLVVVIKLVDLIDETEDLEFSVAPTALEIDETATFTLQVDGAIPDGATDHRVGLLVLGETVATLPTTSDDAAGTYTFEITGPDAAGDVRYESFVKYSCEQGTPCAHIPGQGTLVVVESDVVTVSWTAPE